MAGLFISFSPKDSEFVRRFVEALKPAYPEIRVDWEDIISPDGKYLASAGGHNVPRLWDVATRTQAGEPFEGIVAMWSAWITAPLAFGWPRAVTTKVF